MNFSQLSGLAVSNTVPSWKTILISCKDLQMVSKYQETRQLQREGSALKAWDLFEEATLHSMVGVVWHSAAHPAGVVGCDAANHARLNRRRIWPQFSSIFGQYPVHFSTN
jgi:hypothetical protein